MWATFRLLPNEHVQLVPLPQTHVKRLKRDADEHERRIGELEASQQLVRNEIALHQILVGLGRDDAVVAALGEVYDTPALFEEMRDDPRAFFKSRGVQLPRGATISVEGEGSGASVLMEVSRGRQGFRARWSRSGGFTAEPASETFE